MDNVTKLLTQGAAGASGGKTYIDDVFSTNVWHGASGSDTPVTVTNGIDLTEGGLVWLKMRGVSYNHGWYDTVRGVQKEIASNSSAGQSDEIKGVTSFNSNGFTAGGRHNQDYDPGARTFRKAPKFFDIVTYTGNETVREIAHNLGSVPGCIMLKNLSSTQDWIVYHIGIANNEWSTDPRRARLNLNNTNNAAYSAYGEIWGNTAFTDTHFSLGTYQNSNKNGDNYIAYIFAHNNGDGDFGDDGNKDIIKCTHYIGNNSGGQYVNLGFQPQFILTKATTGSGGGDDWYIFDAMMGLKVAAGDNPYLKPNRNDAEYGGVSEMYRVDSTGFTVDPAGTNYMNGNGRHYIVIAIRCSEGAVGKPVEVGTDAFAMDTGAGSTTIPNFDANFPVDFAIAATPAASGQHRLTGIRLSGPRYMRTNGNDAESGHAGYTFDSNAGWGSQGDGSNWQSWMWKRHAGFDVVAYRGNSTPGRTVQHNLSKIPEMIWIKCRGSATEDWVVGHIGLNGGTNPWEYSLRLNDTSTQIDYPYFNDTAPTSTLFTLNNNGQVNGGQSNNYIAMLFASVAGISKCGYYDGTGAAGHVITTGFLPRLLIIKTTTGANSWFMYDSLRGLGAGNDPYLQLENTNAQASGSGLDVFATSSTGFTINQSYHSVNASGQKYIYYAHA